MDSHPRWCWEDWRYGCTPRWPCTLALGMILLETFIKMPTWVCQLSLYGGACSAKTAAAPEGCLCRGRTSPRQGSLGRQAS